MSKTVEFILDLAAPNGYLAWYPLKDIVARTGAELLVTPVFLGGMHKLTGNAPPMMRDADVKGKVPYAALEFQRFLDRHAMTKFRMHPALPFNSILLQRVLVAAKDQQEMQAPGGFTLGSLGPVSEGLFIWIFGIGGLIAVAVWITAKSN